MSKWIFRLTGLLVVTLIILLFLDRFLNPEMPDYIKLSVDVSTQGENSNVVPPKSPDVPPLSLTSLESDSIQQDSAPTISQKNLLPNEQQSAINFTTLDESENMPILSNPDSQRTNAWLQAGSFLERSNADKRAAVLKAHSWSIEIEPAVIEGKTYYRVYVGPLTNDQVSGYIEKLNTMGINAREVKR